MKQQKLGPTLLYNYTTGYASWLVVGQLDLLRKSTTRTSHSPQFGKLSHDPCLLCVEFYQYKQFLINPLIVIWAIGILVPTWVRGVFMNSSLFSVIWNFFHLHWDKHGVSSPKLLGVSGLAGFSQIGQSRNTLQVLWKQTCQPTC